MTVFAWIRAVLLVLVGLGLLFNVIELMKAYAIRLRWRRLKNRDELKEISAEWLVSSGLFRVHTGFALVLIVYVLVIAPPPRPENYQYAGLLRVAFLWLAIAKTWGGFAARKYRLKIERRIDTAIAKEEGRA